MSPLQEFLIQAKSVGIHNAEPAYRRAGAASARAFKEQPRPAMKASMFGLVDSLAELLMAMPLLDDPDAVVKAGAAICYLVEALRAEMPAPPTTLAQPKAKRRKAAVAGDRFYWQEREEDA